MKVGICLPYAKPELDRSRLTAWCRLVDPDVDTSMWTECRKATGATMDPSGRLEASQADNQSTRGSHGSVIIKPCFDAVWIRPGGVFHIPARLFLREGDRYLFLSSKEALTTRQARFQRVDETTGAWSSHLEASNPDC